MKKSILFSTILMYSFLSFSNSYAQQGLKWSKDGNGYFTTEKGDIVFNELPSFKKNILVSKAFLKSGQDSGSLNIRDFSFSADDSKVLIYTNTKKIWRQDSRGDYWVLDISNKKLHQIYLRAGSNSSKRI